MCKTKKEYKELVLSITAREASNRVPSLPASPLAPVRDLSDLRAADEPPEDADTAAPPSGGEPEGTQPHIAEPTDDTPDECELTKLSDLAAAVGDSLGCIADPEPKTFLERAQSEHRETTVSAEYIAWFTKLELRVKHSAPRARKLRAKKVKSRNRQKAAQTKKEVGEKVSKRQAKRTRYAKLQSDWRERQLETAKEVIRGTWGEESRNLPLDKLVPFWKTLFESPSLEDTRKPAMAYPLKLVLLDEVTVPEATRVLRKAKNGTPGPPRIKLAQVLAIKRDELVTHMNLWLLSGVPPYNFKKGATSLIPKVPVVESPCENRPITLAGMICRIYHRLLAARLEKATRLRSRQRAFTTGDGIAENVAIIRGVAQYCKDKLKPLHVAFIDVAKAFDSVSHQSLLAAAHRLGLPSRLTEYIRRLYAGITTTLKSGGERSHEILSVNCGICQGDPLSPILFNACIDWCLEGISDGIGFETPDGAVLSHLAFADDIVVFAQTPAGLNDQVNRLATEMGKCGLALNTKKSMTYSQLVDGKNKKWVWGTEPCMTVGGKPLNPLMPGETYKYLGTAFAGVKGNPKPLQIVGKGLHNISVAPLKPTWSLKYITLWYWIMLPDYSGIRWTRMCATQSADGSRCLSILMSASFTRRLRRVGWASLDSKPRCQHSVHIDSVDCSNRPIPWWLSWWELIDYKS